MTGNLPPQVSVATLWRYSLPLSITAICSVSVFSRYAQPLERIEIGALPVLIGSGKLGWQILARVHG